MKKGKKIVIGVAAVAVVAGGIYAASGAGRGGSQIPQVAVTKAETGDVEEIVDATGTVVSDEQKTFYSPVNAQIKSVSFAEGDTVTITAGVWKDTVGVIQSINPSKQIVTINVELFGRETPVEIGFTEIKKM